MKDYENDDLNNENSFFDNIDLDSNQDYHSFNDGNFFDYIETIKNRTQSNNDVNVQTYNTSKKPDNSIEGKKENNSLIKKDSKNIKSIRFITNKTRRPKNPSEIKHKFDAFDNINDRIKTNHNNYLISLSNDVLNIIFEKVIPVNYFKKLDYSESKAFSEIKDKKFRDIFYLKIAKKNKGIGKLNYENLKYINKDIYENIVKKYPLLEEFFDKSYLDLFENYYYKNIREFDFKGVHFKLSENTKTYKDLLKKGKNSSVAYKFENVIKKKYLNINKKQ